jgi:hypothetical protein
MTMLATIKNPGMSGINGVTDGFRTHDPQNHNLML